jgi:hypothetical protein
MVCSSSIYKSFSGVPSADFLPEMMIFHIAMVRDLPATIIHEILVFVNTGSAARF